MAADRGQTIATFLPGANADDVEMDGARDAVLKLGVDLRETIVLHDRGIAQITESSRLNDVANNKALHGLVLRDTASAVAAADIAGVAAVHLCTASVTTLESHSDNTNKKNTK